MKFSIQIVAFLWFFYLPSTVNALVLSPGETQFVKEADVTCSLGNTTQFAKVYYGCTKYGEDDGRLTIDSFNSKSGLAETVWLSIRVEDCKSQLNNLKKYKSTISGITKVSFCTAQYYLPQYLVLTYVFSPVGTFSKLSTEESFSTIKDCIEKANVLNASPER
jgi:hypothetical protein